MAQERLARITAHLKSSQGELGSSVDMQACRAQGAAPGFKVALLGASGGIGQPLALLLKMNPLIAVLHLYDVVNTPGVTADLSHTDTSTIVRGFVGKDQLDASLVGMELVIIPAGVPRKPDMTRDDLFNINAGIVHTLCEGVARFCPKAIVHIISNPVNSTVPIAAEVFKKAGTYDPRRLIGVTALDVIRANTFVAEVLGIDPKLVEVPVIGGHAGITILPLLSQDPPHPWRTGGLQPKTKKKHTIKNIRTVLFLLIGFHVRNTKVSSSQVKPASSFTKAEVDYLTNRIQNGGTEVVEAKAGAGSATLSMAYAAAKFADATLRALRGEARIVQCAFVASQVADLPFFASKVLLGRNGVEEVLPLGPLNDYEREGLAKENCKEAFRKALTSLPLKSCKSWRSN